MFGVPARDVTPFDELDLSTLNPSAQIALETLLEEAEAVNDIQSLLTYFHGSDFWRYMNSESTCYQDIGLFVNTVIC